MTESERRIQVGHIQTENPITGYKPDYVYLFLDSESESGSGAIKFASYDMKKVKEFIADYVLENEVHTTYFEIKKQEVTM